MADDPEFEATRKLMRELGYTELEARFTEEAFGSWFIIAQADGKRVRVLWDGREDALIIQRPSLGRGGSWADRWTAGEGYSSKVGDFREGLISVMQLDL